MAFIVGSAISDDCQAERCAIDCMTQRLRPGQAWWPSWPGRSTDTLQLRLLLYGTTALRARVFLSEVRNDSRFRLPRNGIES